MIDRSVGIVRAEEQPYFLRDLLPQLCRLQDFGGGAEAESPGFDFNGAREFEFRQQGAVGLRGELLAGVPG